MAATRKLVRKLVIERRLIEFVVWALSEFDPSADYGNVITGANKYEEDRVLFAKFCRQHKLPPLGVAEMISAVGAAGVAIVDAANNGDREGGRYQRMETLRMTIAEELVDMIGLKVRDWNSGVPWIVDANGHDVFLPCLATEDSDD